METEGRRGLHPGRVSSTISFFVFSAFIFCTLLYGPKTTFQFVIKNKKKTETRCVGDTDPSKNVEKDEQPNAFERILTLVPCTRQTPTLNRV